MMTNLQDKLREVEAELKETRDELRVQLHLAKAEVRDEWEELEQQWFRFNQHMKRVGAEASETSDNVGEALHMLGDELRQGYKRIRRAL